MDDAASKLQAAAKRFLSKAKKKREDRVALEMGIECLSSPSPGRTQPPKGPSGRRRSSKTQASVSSSPDRSDSESDEEAFVAGGRRDSKLSSKDTGERVMGVRSVPEGAYPGVATARRYSNEAAELSTGTAFEPGFFHAILSLSLRVLQGKGR